MCWNQLLLAGLSTGSIYFLTVPSDHTVALWKCLFSWKITNFVGKIVKKTTFMLQKFAMVKYGVFVAKICKHALCASTVRDIWWSPLARQLLPPWAEIFGDCQQRSFTFELYLGTSWTQSPAEARFTKSQLQFKQSAGRMWIKFWGRVEYYYVKDSSDIWGRTI